MEVSRRYEHLNLPMEAIRAFKAVAELGSHSKAADFLHISQPAVSAQIKRLQVLAGGDLFERGPSGSILTTRGSHVLGLASRILDANDQILSLAGSAKDKRPIRLGLTPLHLRRLLAGVDIAQISHVHIHCENSPELSKLLSDGYLDLAVMMDLDDPRFAKRLIRWTEEYSWLRAKSFVLSPGKPLPLICWPGSPGDTPTIRALEDARLAYSVVFASHDLLARIEATKRALGLLATFPEFGHDELQVATEYYLPQLPSRQFGIFQRTGLEYAVSDTATRLVEVLKNVVTTFAGQTPQVHRTRQFKKDNQQ